MIDHKAAEEIIDYLAGVKRSNSEEAKKLRFQNLLLRLFKDSASARLIDQMAGGGEKTIFNIPRKGVPKTGFADLVVQIK